MLDEVSQCIQDSESIKNMHISFLHSYMLYGNIDIIIGGGGSSPTHPHRDFGRHTQCCPTGVAPFIASLASYEIV